MKKLLLALACLTAGTVQAAPTNAEIDCLARIGYFEARGESLAGQKAVMHVTLNRVRHSEYPDTVCANLVPSQYQWLRNRPRIHDWRTYHEIRRVAADLYAAHLLGVRQDNTGGAYFFSSNGVRPAARAYSLRRIGNHQFYGLRRARS